MSRTPKDERFDDERPTGRGGKPSSDADYHVGRLMVESLNFRRRLEVVESRLAHLEDAKKDSAPPASGSIIPGGRARLFALIKKTLAYTVVGIAAIISTLKELGYFGK